LLTVKVRYKAPSASESQLIEQPMRPGGAAPHVAFAAAVAEFGMILRDSPHKGDATMAEVIATARAAKDRDSHGYRAEFVSLAETAELLMTPAVGTR